MIGKLVILRIKQGFRILSQNGLNGMIFMSLTLVALPFLFRQIHSNSLFIFYTLVFFVILYIHSLRKDKIFLENLRVNDKIFIFFEYLVITLFFVASTISSWSYRDLYYLSVLLISSIFLIVFLKNRFSNPFEEFEKKVTSLVPVSAYELRIGLRRYFYVFFVIYFVSFCATPFLPLTPVFCIFLSTFVFEFFKDSPPKEFVQKIGNVDLYLEAKIRINLILVHFFLLPLFIVFFFYHLELGKLGILVFSDIILSLCIIYSICLKYSTRKFKTFKSVLFFIVSPIIPISIYLLLKEKKEAKCQLITLLK